ncbi:MAG: TIGR04283 family arsenosugar biosynthesis glycosyltransferase [Actinomycetota bacterium]|nr:TIGR04283 family arsenosugar biosynthesis glycosyltransferase [Actinomycetota bacterium]
MKLSVVVPTLNESANIDALLERLRHTPGVGEVVVADGGSTDDTPELVRQPARLVRARSGRGFQLNAGAREVSGDVLLFLHADVVSPPDVAVQIGGAVKRGYVGGNFRLSYPGGGLLGRWLEILAPFYRALGRYYGDSGIFVRCDVYERMGGFPEIPVMEDLVFVRKLEGAGKTAYLPGPMVSSPRRWQRGSLRTLLLWAFMQAAFALGVSPWWLADFYKVHSAGRPGDKTSS